MPGKKKGKKKVEVWKMASNIDPKIPDDNIPFEDVPVAVALEDSTFDGKEHHVKVELISYKIGVLTAWFLKKHRQYSYRQHENKFCFELAKRLLEIIEHEPDHEIAKVLKE